MGIAMEELQHSIENTMHIELYYHILTELHPVLYIGCEPNPTPPVCSSSQISRQATLGIRCDTYIVLVRLKNAFSMSTWHSKANIRGFKWLPFFFFFACWFQWRDTLEVYSCYSVMLGFWCIFTFKEEWVTPAGMPALNLLAYMSQSGSSLRKTVGP